MRQRLAIAVIVALAIAGFQMGRAGGSADRAKLISVIRWQISEGWFGGYSGLELSDNGDRLIAVSDRGHFIEAPIRRSGSVITEIGRPVVHRVMNKKGDFAKRTGQRDSEGLAQTGNGPIFVSFEGDHRVGRFSGPAAREQLLPTSPGFARMADNGGMEALALDEQSRLWAFPESPIGSEDRVHVFRLERGVWRKPIMLSRDKQFQPVGADFGPDGRLYLLERGFNGFGFRVRVRSFSFSGDTVADEKLVLRKGIGVHDNLEGLSVWRDSLGHIRLTMISDDNFRLLQRTEIVEYALTETP